MDIVIAISGWITALAGLVACVWPIAVFEIFKISVVTKANWFFIRHWGFLVFLVGVLTALDMDRAILLAAALEKLLLVGMIFFGTIPRTRWMTVIALVDGSFAVLYIGYMFS
jgi:hypothetical protein